MNKLPGYSVPDLSAPVAGTQSHSVFFKEFVVRTRRPAKELVNELAEEGIIPGLDLGRYYSARKNELLIAVTEMNTLNCYSKFPVLAAVKSACRRMKSRKPQYRQGCVERHSHFPS